MRKLWYTLSITSAAFLAGIGVGAYSGISITVLNAVLYGAFAWFIVSNVISLWMTRERRGSRR